tara:strand:+ start:1460 stop:1822 length:363 start_codon:yes stop_codon:yes gene_type:complete
MESWNKIKQIMEFPVTPITEKTFERQGWEKHIDKDESNGEEYYYYMLPLPKDNPDVKAFCFVSSTNDEYQDLENLNKGEYYVEIDGMFGLGACYTEEELEVLYRALTKQHIESDKLSSKK